MQTEGPVFRRVLVLYTGGTIGMCKNKDKAYAPAKNKFVEKVKSLQQFHNEKLSEALGLLDELVVPEIYKKINVIYKIMEYDPLLDSSNMSIKDWIRIATDIESNYEKYDGFVVLHGTDTIAYTASTLSFMLEGLNKPVILTGSQVPIFEARNDAKENFFTSLILSSSFYIPEVCVYFYNKLFRGNRITKVSSNHLEAFSSPNYHILAVCGINIEVYQNYLLQPTHIRHLTVFKSLNSNVGLVRLFPTITNGMLQSFLKPPVEGIVLESYGSGNVPSEREDILRILAETVQRGVIVINVTQCIQGAVTSSYAAGKVLASIGVLPGYDMTPEAALSKLSFVLSLKGITLEEKKKMMTDNLRGELTITEMD